MRSTILISLRGGRVFALAALVLLVCAGREASAQQPLSLISANVSGAGAGNGPSYYPTLSADGRYAAFQSSSSDILAGDNNNTEDVFVRDLQTGAVTLVSVNRQGTGSANRGSGTPSISADGRFVVFASNATDLTTTPQSTAAPFASQVYVRDLVLQRTTLVSVNAAGTAGGNHNSLSPVVSPDGRFVAFVSVASDLTAHADNGGRTDVYLRDTQAGTTKLASVNAPGTGAGNRDSGREGAGSVGYPLLSADGRFVAFNSSATDLVGLPDANDAGDVFVRDTLTDTTALVSVNQAGTAAANGQSEITSLSADGRRVVFGSTARDLTADTGAGAVRDVFVRDTAAQTTALVSVTLSGAPSGYSLGGRITPGGRFVAFSSYSPSLVTGVQDTSGKLDVFVRDLQTKTTALVSINKWGTRAADGDSYNAGISDDGRFVAFQSEAANLVENADNYSTQDVFVRDLAAGVTRLASLSTAGGGAGSSNFPVISGDGRRVAFHSYATNLLPLSDTNGGSDLYAYAVPQEVPEPSFVQFAAADYTAFESGGSFMVTVTRTGNTSAPATVEYATADVTASDRTDYGAALGTLHFAAGQTLKTFDVIVNDDPFVEGQEEFTITLSSPYRARLGAQAQATVHVLSNDAAPEGSLNYSDDTYFFVRQQYRDFLNREPDDAGFAFWMGEIEQCGDDAQCREVKRVNVSAAFFLSIEFQETGFFVYRARMVASGQTRGANDPAPLTLREFLHDTQAVARGVVVGEPGWQLRLEANKQAYLEELVGRESFTDVFPLYMGAGQAYVYKLYDGTNRQLPQAVLNDLLGKAFRGEMTRVQFLRAVAEDPTFTRNETNRAFVLMQYYGYLRRNPYDAPEPNRDFAGYNYWLSKLNEFNGNYVQAEMVKAFITSTEYRQRFGQP